MDKPIVTFYNYRLWRKDYKKEDGTEWSRYSISVTGRKNEETGKYSYETINAYLPEGTEKIHNGTLVNISGWLTKDKPYLNKNGEKVEPFKIDARYGGFVKILEQEAAEPEAPKAEQIEGFSQLQNDDIPF